MQTPSDPKDSAINGGLGNVTNRKKEQVSTDPKDEKNFIWRDYKPGFEINQHGHIRTKGYGPGA